MHVPSASEAQPRLIAPRNLTFFGSLFSRSLGSHAQGLAAKTLPFSLLLET